MGFKQVDLVPIGTNGPTAITPPGKAEQTRIFQVLRTDTSSTLKVVLPAQATLLSAVLFPGTASNAGTTATVTLTFSNNAGSLATGTANVLTAGVGTNGGAVTMTGLPNLEPLPLLGDLLLTAVYAETGTASSAGGPFIFRITYVA